MLSRAGKTNAPESSRLDAKAWTAAALDLLAEKGIDGVRVEPLAKRLDVTKGSFYWHFKDRDALFATMLDDWRRRATLQIIERIEKTEESPRSRLRALLRIPFSGPRSNRGAEIELSMRLWARRDVRARAALEEVDQLRLRYVAQLLSECGLAVDQCAPRAIIAYAYMRVASTLIDDKDQTMLDQCEEMLLAS